METLKSIKVEKAHCLYCFKTLYSYLNNQQLPAYPPSLLDAKCPLFVTWRIGSQKELRGCIGTFDNSQFLSKLLPKYALQSAVNDPRFSPITMKEFSDLSVAVSLLINFEYPEQIWDWEVGMHGIHIQFEYPEKSNNYYSGTFLPEVAKEQGWTKEQTMEMLVKKAGFYKEEWKKVLPSLKLERYESSKIELSYGEFLREGQSQEQNQN